VVTAKIRETGLKIRRVKIVMSDSSYGLVYFITTNHPAHPESCDVMYAKCNILTCQSTVRSVISKSLNFRKKDGL
jgi:hypothetical protein